MKYSAIGHRITLHVIPQDPWTTPDPVPVKIQGGLLPGPVGSRIAVFDYNRDRDEIYEAATPRDDGTFPEYDVDDLRFHQLNAYAISARAIELVEMELGRELQWGFDASRLILLPHAGYLDNAFYSEDTHSLQFYSFQPIDSSDVFHTALSHDIVAHETGHAILDAVRDRFTEGLDPETAALHEAVGDLATIFAGMSHEIVFKQAATNLADANLVSKIAEHFMGHRHPLRNLLAEPQPESYWETETSPHGLSLKLTRAIYGALLSLQENRINAGMDRVAALRLALRALQRMAVRGLDYLPPADATFSDYAQAILKADWFANPDDRFGFRKIVKDKLAEHGVLTDNEYDQRGEESDMPWPNRPPSWPNLTMGDAYRFLDQNRDRLALSLFAQYRDFVVRDVQSTIPPTKRSIKEKVTLEEARSTTRITKEEVEQVILVYDYPVEVELNGQEFGRAAGRWISIWGGGTLVFDVEGKLRHHARKPATKERVKRVIDFLRSGVVSGRVRPIEATLEDEIRRHQFVQPWMLALSPDGAVLRTNPAARCRPPRHVSRR